MISEHANNAVAKVHGKARKHPPHFRVQRRKRFDNKCMWRCLSSFGGQGNCPSRWKISDSISSEAIQSSGRIVRYPY
jgi:hypothetical protein